MRQCCDMQIDQAEVFDDAARNQQVRLLLEAIEREKKEPIPNRKRMKFLLGKIRSITGDWRAIHSADGCSKFQCHTSTREFETETDGWDFGRV